MLTTFKQRGKSIAFIPQNVSLLRERLRGLQQQRASIEEQVVDLTTEMSLLDEQSAQDRKRLAALDRPNGRRSLGVHAPSLQQLDELRARVASHDATRTQLQQLTNKCIEDLFELSNVLDATDEQHNDDSLLQ